MWMKKPIRLIMISATVVAIGLFSAWFKYGTVNPCGILRAKLRNEMTNEGPLGKTISALMPDSAMDVLLEAKYGKLTPATCLNFLISPPRPHADDQDK